MTDRNALVEGLAKRDETAWTVFVRDYGRLIQAVVNRFDLPPGDRADVFQDACVAIDRSIHRLRDPEKLSTWVYGLTYRTCLLALRTRRRDRLRNAVDLDAVGGIVDPFSDAERDLARLQEIAVVRDAVESIGPPCSNLLAALHLQEPPLSYKEYAEQEGIPLGSVGPTRKRCLEKLRKTLREVFDRPETETSVRRTR